MGGSWSGRWGGHARRLTVEEAFLAFDVAACREVLTQPDGTRGEACWGDATRIGVRVGTLPNGYRTLRLAYAIQIDDAPQEEYGEELAVEPVRQPLGGRRWYFRCPRCDRRCACLYLVRRAFRFRCGRCHGLAYHGHRLDRVARHQRLFRQIVRHLGEDPDVDGWGHLPARPECGAGPTPAGNPDGSVSATRTSEISRLAFSGVRPQTHPVGLLFCSRCS